MAHKGGGLNNFGETAARRALRENTVAVTNAIQRHLAVFPRYLKQTRFMTESQWDDVSSTTHSNAHKANDYMRAVESKVDSGNNPDRGREWLKELMGILMRQDIGEYVVAQDMAKVYIKHADSGTEDFAFFKQIAHQQVESSSCLSSDQSESAIMKSDQVPERLDEVKSNIYRVSSKFLSLKNAIKCELETPKDGREAVSISDAVDMIMNSPTADWEPHELNILQMRSEQLRTYKNVQGVLDCLGLEWDYLNPDIYEVLINDFSLHSLDHQLKEYQRELDQFLDKTPVKEFSDVITKNKQKPIPKEFRNLVFKHKWKLPVYLRQVELFRREVASQYKLRRCAVFIAGLGIKSIIITLVVPASIEEELYSTEPKFLIQHGIMQMTINDIPIHLGYTPLHVASESGQTDVVSLLLDHGAKWRDTTDQYVMQANGYAQIHTAASNNEISTVKNAINNNKTLRDLLTPLDESPIHIACLHGSYDVVQLLVREGARLHSRTSDDGTVVHYAASSGCDKTLHYILSRKGMSQLVNSTNKVGDTPAHHAMRIGCVECVRVLRQHGAKFTQNNLASQTPIDLATMYGNTQCMAAAVQDPPHLVVCGTTDEPSCNQRSYDVPAVVSLSNDEKTKFHKSTDHETDGDNRSHDEDSENTTSAWGMEHPKTCSKNGVISHNMMNGEGHSSEEGVPLAPSQPMKSKTLTKKLPSKSIQQSKEKVYKQIPTTTTTYNKAHKQCDEHQLPSPDRVETPHAKRSHECSVCGREKVLLETFIDKPLGISAGHTGVVEGRSMKFTELICHNCQPSPYTIGPRKLSGIADKKGHSSKIKDKQLKNQSKGTTHKNTEEKRNKSVSLTENNKESDISDDEAMSPILSKNIDPPQNAASVDPPQNAASTDPPQNAASIDPPHVDIEGPRDVKLGEDVTLRADTNIRTSYQLSYHWYQVQRGKPDKSLGTAVELNHCMVKKTIRVFCRVTLNDEKATSFDSKHVTITPKLVWITSQLTLNGGYYGKRAVLRCRAEKHHSLECDIRYLWLKKKSANERAGLYRHTDTAKLTFDHLSPENNGIYICQADVQTKSVSDFVETKEITVQGCIEPGFVIIKQPWSQVVNIGSSFQLQCRAMLKNENGGTLSYQWFHNNTIINGASACIYKRPKSSAMDTGHYRCKVTDEKGISIFTQLVNVSLAYQEDTNDDAKRSMKQFEQLKAEKILQTSDGTRYACGKVALVIGNTAYHHHRQLTSSITDVLILTEELTHAGFKVFSLINLTCSETMMALEFITNMLVPGAYVVFAYSGHGCNLRNTDYIIPIDAHCPIDPHQCVASATVCEHLQLKLCRVFLLMNCCRSTPEDSHPAVPQHERSSNYANCVIFTASTEGHHSYEENGKASSFITLFVEALREGGKFRNMFDKVQERMKKNYVSVGGCTFAKPTVVHSGMDLHITFQDDIMVDSNGIEEVLDRLEDKWRSVNTPPNPVKLLPDNFGSKLSAVLRDVELIFECVCSNVLEVIVKWNVYHPTSTTCTVDMIDKGQGVGIKRLSMENCEACFEVNSLQKLTGNLQLHLVFTVSSTNDPHPESYPVIHDLQLRPLYAQHDLQLRPLYAQVSCP